MESLYCPGGQVHFGLVLAAALLQLKPVNIVHTEVSHVHSSLFAICPLVLVQSGGGRQVLVSE